MRDYHVLQTDQDQDYYYVVYSDGLEADYIGFIDKYPFFSTFLSFEGFGKFVIGNTV